MAGLSTSPVFTHYLGRDLELGTAPRTSRQRRTGGNYQRGAAHWTQRRPDQRPRGERQSNARLTWEQVRAIRRRHQAGEQQQALAKEYGVSPATVSEIVHGKTWREEPEATPERAEEPLSA